MIIRNSAIVCKSAHKTNSSEKEHINYYFLKSMINNKKNDNEISLRFYITIITNIVLKVICEW